MGAGERCGRSCRPRRRAVRRIARSRVDIDARAVVVCAARLLVLVRALERGDRGAVILRITLMLVTRSGTRACRADGADARRGVLRTMALPISSETPRRRSIGDVGVRSRRRGCSRVFARALPTHACDAPRAAGRAHGHPHRRTVARRHPSPRPFAMAKFDPPRSLLHPHPSPHPSKSQRRQASAALVTVPSRSSSSRAALPRDYRSPWYGRRPRRALRRPMASSATGGRRRTAMSGTCN